ncbi:MAG TPA: molybdate ABC transporter substrate-binding protein [Propionibacteriaceae bacterium]
MFAAASLKGAFTQIGSDFETRHPDIGVRFSFAGSADLATQLIGGAPADVFASADEANMAKASREGLVVGSAALFASNTLQIAVPAANPAGISALADLAKPGALVVVCAPVVPCGAATRRVEQAAGVRLRPVSQESSVTDVLNKVTTGEADAGLVYRTDVQAARSKVTGISFPEAAAAVNHYPIAVMAAGEQQGAARDFVDLVTGPAGQQVLRRAGFGQP